LQFDSRFIGTNKQNWMIRSPMLTKPEIAYMTDKEFRKISNNNRLTRRELKAKKRLYMQIVAGFKLTKKGLQAI